MTAVNFLAILLVSFTTLTQVIAQGVNPHERHMERAHPTPEVNRKPPDNIIIPFVQATGFGSLFTNSNMIIDENDVLPVQNESSIAVNPINPRMLIGSAVDYRGSGATWAYYSTDAGLTWQNVTLGKARDGWSSSNDPSVCFDHEGTGYLCYGGFNRTGNVTGNVQFGENGIFISSTTDGGKTWNPMHTAVIIHTGQQTADSAFEDKYYVHADTVTGSPYRGRLYIPWKRVINADSSTGIVIATSSDKGRTWKAPVAVSNRFPKTSEDTTFGQSFPLARTSPNGNVHVVWNSGTESSVRYAASTDGGATFSTPRIIQTYKPFGVKTTVSNQTNSRVKGVVRAEAYPSLSIDNTNGPRRGWLYLVWSADQTPNVYFSKSVDNGATWSAAQIIHSVTTNDQFWPWIALDPTNGDLAVMYFDSRDDPANILVNCYVSYSSNGGTTWTDRRVGSGDNDLRRNPFAGNTFAGDYSGCDFYNGKIYPSWVDMRHTTATNMSDNDVYTGVVSVRAPAAPETFTASTIPDQQTKIALKWSAVTETSFGIPLADSEAVYILKRKGTRIATLALNITEYTDTGLVAHDLYSYTLTVASKSDTSSDRNAQAWAGGSKLPAAPTIITVRGTEDAQLKTMAKLPNVRLDSITPLVNLASIEFLFNGKKYLKNVAASDSGMTLPFEFAAGADGWYWISARAIDSSGNKSNYSDSILTFTGSTMWNREVFDTLPNFAVLNGKWNRVTDFAYSLPASYTESPNSLYGSSRRDTVLLYPRRLGETDLGSTVMSWRVAAFVDPGDTAFIEYSLNNELGPWQQAAWYNSSLDARWTDTTKSADAWRFGSFVFTGVSKLAYFRLRFYSNVVKQSDGFYIDDISFEEKSSVDDDSKNILGMFPQPASESVVVGIVKAESVTAVSVRNINGSVLPSVQWYSSGMSLVVDLQSVPSGIYSLHIRAGASEIVQQLVVLH
ncbi:MAG: exo-alpha-sialidase [Ignavibacteria bacterium]|nr:exo-alpha-sialidase [Ignavibacteria bacterium]